MGSNKYMQLHKQKWAHAMVATLAIAGASQAQVSKAVVMSMGPQHGGVMHPLPPGAFDPNSNMTLNEARSIAEKSKQEADKSRAEMRALEERSNANIAKLQEAGVTRSHHFDIRAIQNHLDQYDRMIKALVDVNKPAQASGALNSVKGNWGNFNKSHQEALLQMNHAVLAESVGLKNDDMKKADVLIGKTLNDKRRTLENEIARVSKLQLSPVDAKELNDLHKALFEQ